MSDHTWYKCTGCKSETYCIYCDGGLSSCTVCGGAEGSLPTECPGRLMTPEEQDQVYQGPLDFSNCEWTTKLKIEVKQ